MSRPHNIGLNSVLISYDDPEGETIQTRPSNPALMGLLAATNEPQYVEQQSISNDEPRESLSGGKLKSRGWDPSHPRLSRDPTWYPGRGMDRAKQALGSVASIVETGAKVAEMVG
jgi:hypothetical protein